MHPLCSERRRQPGLKVGLNGCLYFIEQLKATAVFGAFFTGNLFKGFTLHLQRQLPAEAESFLPSRDAQNSS
jgi:hypothetical protein